MWSESSDGVKHAESKSLKDYVSESRPIEEVKVRLLAVCV